MFTSFARVSAPLCQGNLPASQAPPASGGMIWRAGQVRIPRLTGGYRRRTSRNSHARAKAQHRSAVGSETLGSSKITRATRAQATRQVQLETGAKPGAFAELPLRYSHRAFITALCREHRASRAGWPPGQPERFPTLRLSWGEDHPESDVVVPVLRVVVVAIRRPAVDRVVVPTAAADHAAARGPPARFALTAFHEPPSLSMPGHVRQS